jgi:heme A synthase
MRKIVDKRLTRFVTLTIIAIGISTLMGKATVLFPAGANCSNWISCALSEFGGWLKPAHIFSTGIAATLVLVTFITAWRNHRTDTVLLPLSVVLSVLFIGQSMIGGIQILRNFPVHLRVLHTIGALILYFMAGLYLLRSQLQQYQEKDPNRVHSSPWRQRIKDFLPKPLIMLLLLLTLPDWWPEASGGLGRPTFLDNARRLLLRVQPAHFQYIDRA